MFQQSSVFGSKMDKIVGNFYHVCAISIQVVFENVIQVLKKKK